MKPLQISYVHVQHIKIIQTKRNIFAKLIEILILNQEILCYLIPCVRVLSRRITNYGVVSCKIGPGFKLKYSGTNLEPYFGTGIEVAVLESLSASAARQS